MHTKLRAAPEGGHMTTEQEARERLLSLHERHPYHRFVEEWIRPKEARDTEAWHVAETFACRLLADDVGSFDRRHGGIHRRLRAVALFCYDLAVHDPHRMTVDYALTDARVTEWAARFKKQAKERTGQKAELQNSYVHQMRTEVLSLRRNYPHLADRRELLGPMDTQHRVPMSDDHFRIAYDHTDTFRKEHIRRHSKAAMLMARGAGLENGAMIWVRRRHVRRGPGGALWVLVPSEANRPGDVPVDARFAADLEVLARFGNPDHLMVLDAEPPVMYERGSSVVSTVALKLSRFGHHWECNISVMRAAWMNGNLANGTPLLSLFQASRLGQMDALLRSIGMYAAPGATTPDELARDLGAIDGEVAS